MKTEHEKKSPHGKENFLANVLLNTIKHESQRYKFVLIFFSGNILQLIARWIIAWAPRARSPHPSVIQKDCI